MRKLAISTDPLVSHRPIGAAVALFLLLTFSTGATWTGTPGASTFSAPLSGSFFWLVVRCHANDESAEPESTDYFAQLFTVDGMRALNMVDYWHDVSFGKISINGTTVATAGADKNGWYTVPDSQAQYDKLSREQEVQVCANAASADYNLGNFYGIIAVYPSTDTLASGGEAGNYGQTSISFSGVNGKGGGTFSLALVNLPSNVNETFASHEIGHGFGLHHSRLLSTSTAGYCDGFDVMSAMCVYSLTPPTSDATNTAFGGSNLGSVAAAKGPGLDAITLDDEGWIPLGRIGRAPGYFQGTMHLHSLSDPAALTDNPAPASAGGNGELLEDDIPAKVTFPFSPPGQNCSSSQYTLEYREPVRWDADLPTEASYWNPKSQSQLNEMNSPAFPIGSVVMHLLCVSSWDPPPASYGFSLLVDAEPAGGGHVVAHNTNFYSAGAPLGAYFPGDEYADDASGFYFAVNSESTSNHDVTFTIATLAGPIADKLTILGPGEAADHGTAEVSAQLKTKAPAPENVAVVPGHPVTFRLGSAACTAVTDLDGTATCSLPTNGRAFSRATLTAQSAATRAYLAASATASIFFELPAQVVKRTTLGTRVPQVHVVIHRPKAPPPPHGQGV